MVSVQYIVDSLFSLIKKSQSGGYFTDDELTNFFSSAQTSLFEYYMTQKNKGSKDAQDALQPFLKSTTITYTNGTSPFPSDFFHADTMMATWTKNNCDGIEIQDIPIPFITQSEYSLIVKDGNRKPNILKQRAYYSFVNNLINVYPRSITSSEFIYYRPPVAAVYSTVTQSTPLGTVQVYDPLTSVNFEWDAAMQENLLTLCMFYSGISIRENAVVQYAQQKQQQNLIR